jgi:hypothetical protein
MKGKRKASRVATGFEPSARTPRPVAAVVAEKAAGIVSRAAVRGYPSLAEVSAAALASALLMGNAGCSGLGSAPGSSGEDNARAGDGAGARVPLRAERAAVEAAAARGGGPPPTVPGTGGFASLDVLAGPAESNGSAVLVPVAGGFTGGAGPGEAEAAASQGGALILPVSSHTTAGVPVPVRPSGGPAAHEEVPCEGAEATGDGALGHGVTTLDDGSNLHPPVKPSKRPLIKPSKHPPTILGRIPHVRSSVPTPSVAEPAAHLSREDNEFFGSLRRVGESGSGSR